MRRYVIYIKRGVYKQNVEIMKKKWKLVIGIISTVGPHFAQQPLEEDFRVYMLWLHGL
jgi:hypothetical protein